MDERQRKIVAAGRSLLRVPYHKDGKNPDQGLDCVNFVTLSHEMAGYPLPIVQKDMTGFHAINDNRLVEFIVEKGGIQIPEPEWQATDVVLMKYGEFPHHVAFLTERNEQGDWSMLHSTAKYDMVVEELLIRSWRKRLHSVWRSPQCRLT